MIYCFGCSFTEHTKTSFIDNTKTNFDRWPKVIEKETGIKTKNFGLAGQSNDYISTKIKYELLKNKPKVVLVAWTEWYRQTFLGSSCLNYSIAMADPYWIDSESDWYKENKKRIDKELNLVNNFLKFFEYKNNNISQSFVQHQILNNYITIEHFCKSHNIPIFHLQALNPIPLHIKDKKPANISSYNIEKEFYNYIHLFDKNFIGWPIFQSYGGFSVDDILTDEYLISEKDGHPNELGHKFIANLFLEKL